MTTPHEGTTTPLDLASELAEVAPHVKEGFDLGRACKLMQRAAEVIERLAPLIMADGSEALSYVLGGKENDEIEALRRRVEELEAYNATRTDELMAAGKQLAAANAKVEELTNEIARQTKVIVQVNTLNDHLGMTLRDIKKERDNFRDVAEANQSAMQELISVKEQLAAAQADNARLREALALCSPKDYAPALHHQIYAAALATTPGHSALTERLAQERKQMIDDWITTIASCFKSDDLLTAEQVVDLLSGKQTDAIRSFG